MPPCCRRGARARAGVRRAAERDDRPAARATAKSAGASRTSPSWRSTTPASRRSASAPIRSALMRRAASRSSSATCSATTSLATSAQVTSRFDEFGGSAFYLNRTHRWNWGVGADQTPYVSRGFATGYDVAGGQPVLRRRRIPDPAAATAASPACCRIRSAARSASRSRGGFRQIGLSRTSRSRAYDLSRLAARRRTGPTWHRFPTLNLAQASAALVYDTSISGADQSDPRQPLPLRAVAERRLADATPGVLADVRTYLMPVRPYTLRAARALLRPLRQQRRGPAAADACISGIRAWCAATTPDRSRPGECGDADGRLLPGLRSADRQPRRRSRTPSCASRSGARSAASSFYGPLPVELGGLLRRRRRVGRTTRRRSFTDGDHQPGRQRRRRRAHQRVRVRGRGDRLRPPARPPGPRLAVAVQPAAWISESRR